MKSNRLTKWAAAAVVGAVAVAIGAAAVVAAARSNNKGKTAKADGTAAETKTTTKKSAKAPKSVTSERHQATAAQVEELINKGLDYLKSQQKEDGGWHAEKEPPAITALVLRSFVTARPESKNEEFVQKGYEKLLSYQVDSGGIYRDLLANYNTAIAVSALVAAGNPEYEQHIRRAIAYLKGLQWTPETDPEFPDKSKKPKLVTGEDDPFFGGFGYGGHSRGAGRPDLSNTHMTLEALKEAGLDESDPAFQRAVQFVQRLQNHSETNDQPWAGEDGGCSYSPADTRLGESFAGEYTTPDGERRLRSYGSMTYAGLKSYIYAGLTKDDPRVKAAWDWITKNWTLDENPGMRLADPANAQHGLYYYYYTMAKALGAYDEPVITDPQGNEHDWRVELVAKLAELQKSDGSWTGEEKWQEGNPVLVTAYVVLALQEIRQDLQEHPVQ